MAANPWVVTASIEAVQIAAAFVIQDDEVWDKFEKFMTEIANTPLPPGARQLLDKAIETSDVVRQSICEHHGIPSGEPYPRKYND